MAAGTGVAYKNGHLQVISAQFTLDPGSIGAGANEDQTVAIDGCRVGDTVIVGPRAPVTNGIVVTGAHVSAAGTVTFTLENHTAGGIDLASAVWDVMILRGLYGGAFA